MSERSPESVVNTDPSQPSIQHVGDSVTTGTIPVITDATRLPERGLPRPVRRPLNLWLSVLGLGSVLLGALAGVVWRFGVDLPTYQVNDDGSAVTSERGLSQFIAADAWFVVLGLICGLICGLVVWKWFAGLGWPMVFLAIASATVMALTCWQLGWLLGPGPLEPRLAAARPGEVLPIELTLRAQAALLVWPFAACLPIMLFAALSHDPEEPADT
ncbi:hypothetical protein CGZ98_17940 [Enemella evansiae]|uniref:hypothetical protein n=1 Tax=Enemella evansiae TaxID=2016499 RepID=UPI000B9621F6|nr:hypothetical protein [Enemella evansiae]OYO07354.1 hypothetical protein CGZ98_17940 [Enemella evansiae]